MILDLKILYLLLWEYPRIKVRVMGVGQEVGYTLDQLSFHHRANTQRQTTMLLSALPCSEIWEQFAPKSSQTSHESPSQNLTSAASTAPSTVSIVVCESWLRFIPLLGDPMESFWCTIVWYNYNACHIYLSIYLWMTLATEVSLKLWIQLRFAFDVLCSVSCREAKTFSCTSDHCSPQNTTLLCKKKSLSQGTNISPAWRHFLTVGVNNCPST